MIRSDIRNSALKVIYWSHNYVHADFCRFVNRTPQIKCNVFVGKQQYDRYIDNDIIKKSITIFNLFNDDCTEHRRNDSRSVVFVGAIVNRKGFYEMCRIWKGIVKEVPDAELHVMGSGRLYGDAKLGRYGIASESYERMFMPLITDDAGEILPSVKFHGIVGPEKQQRFLTSAVGVVNPCRSSETFGMVIVEMASAELPVVTIEKNGYYDTVVSGRTGVLGRSLTDIQRHIIGLLRDPARNESLGAEAKTFIRKFSPEQIVPQWKRLLDAVYEDKLNIVYSRPVPPFSSDLKWLRRLLRFVRFELGLGFIPSLTDLEYVALRVRDGLRNRLRVRKIV